MGKSKKRKHEDSDPKEELKKLLKKVKKLEERMGEKESDAIKDGGTAPEQNENVVQNDQKQPAMVDAETTEGDESTKEDELFESNKDLSEEDAEAELEWQAIVGEDPSISRSMETSIRADLLKVWKYFCREGMKKVEEEPLIAKYACVEDLQAPKLNPQIMSTLKEAAKSRDGHMSLIQKLAGLALSITGSLMTKIYENRHEGMEIKEILDPLRDTGKILALLVHKQSINRKAFIEPGLAKDSVDLLKDTKIDEFLYGKDLSTKIKESKAMTKEGEGLAKVPQPKPVNQNRPSNYKAPYDRRPPKEGMRSTATRGRRRQRLYFKNNRQFVNSRSQAPPRNTQPPPPPKQTSQ